MYSKNILCIFLLKSPIFQPKCPIYWEKNFIYVEKSYIETIKCPIYVKNVLFKKSPIWMKFPPVTPGVVQAFANDQGW